ncbi:hypothetical protein [Clostridium niameyense]|nr:hypothetical protein [Clostridium niameyense]
MSSILLLSLAAMTLYTSLLTSAAAILFFIVPLLFSNVPINPPF